ncbi:sulfonate transporter [Candidatus Kaiserbacteria bacterium RIFCSPHIGHO2_02_FULL_49_34]|uniref:Probable membrane transporter protein n=1 Tax=Candidatus Kaiserbacteria bacterium RIFCSPHIGHO2_02_FULL_49_34 TaxID=1798491 RepID=A0A1F6DIZ1_9BACT|nr:MAG: sulfonate transporter [Candidatus Kaiserbacteria bacterium RIFCSPHIGHO2_02_FULL_49_34]
MEWIFLSIAFFAEVAGTIAGFGSSTIALPLALFLFDFQTALVLVAFLHIFGNIGRIGFFRHGLDKGLLLRFGVPSIALTLVGALLVQSVPQDILKMILGVFLILYVFWAWTGKRTVTPSLTTSVIGGGVSGFFAGLIGTGGALRAAFLTSFHLSKERYIATAATIALMVDITRLPVYLAGGFLSPEHSRMIPVLLVVALVGTYVGKIIVRNVPQMLFRHVVLVAIGSIGVKFIIDFIGT